MRRIQVSGINTIYFGGGTPSLLPAKSLENILDTIKNNYFIQEDAEITLEANPGTIDPEYLQSALSIGINRLSIGIQSLDEIELNLLGRIHSSGEARDALHQAKTAGFNNISVDFIYGIPGRTLEKWNAMLCEIVNLEAQHISLYGLTIEENTPLFERVKQEEIAAPNPDSAASEYEMAEDILADYGYSQYEISNWSVPGYESRHNLAYWQRVPYLGLGVAAHSFLGNRRIANTCDLDEYLDCLKKGTLPPQSIEVINAPEALSETLFLGLRLNRGVDADDINAQFGINLYEHFADEIKELVSLGLLVSEGRRIVLTPRGRLLGNEVFIRFLS